MNSEVPTAILEHDGPASTSRARALSLFPRGQALQLIGAWLLVGIPLAYGFYETLVRAAKLFTE